MSKSPKHKTETSIYSCPVSSSRHFLERLENSRVHRQSNCSSRCENPCIGPHAPICECYRAIERPVTSLLQV